MPREYCKVKFNKDRNWFELRMPDGTKIPAQISMQLEDTLSVDTHKGPMVAVVRFYVQWDGETSDQQQEVETQYTDISREEYLRQEWIKANQKS